VTEGETHVGGALIQRYEPQRRKGGAQ
jgi:hypothetical protein